MDLSPDDVYSHYKKGITLFALGRYDEALLYIDKIIEAELNDPMAHYIKGVSLFALGQHDDAILCFDKAIEIKPDYVDAYFAKGSALIDLDRDDEALSYFDRFFCINCWSYCTIRSRTTTLQKKLERFSPNYGTILPTLPLLPWRPSAHCLLWSSIV